MDDGRKGRKAMKDGTESGEKKMEERVNGWIKK